jgi:hypothetical protein
LYKKGEPHSHHNKQRKKGVRISTIFHLSKKARQTENHPQISKIAPKIIFCFPNYVHIFLYYFIAIKVVKKLQKEKYCVPKKNTQNFL